MYTNSMVLTRRLADALDKMRPLMTFFSILTALSMVSGQIPDRLIRQGDPASTDYTGQIRSFAEFGAGLNTNPPPLLCHAVGTGNVVMTAPNGSFIDISRVHPASPATGSQLYVSGWPGNGAVILHRGPDYFSPDGDYCCGRRNWFDAQYLIKNENICLTLTSCPTLTPVNGTITYNATTNQANYTCNDGYTLSGTSPITCNETTSSWSATQPTCHVLCPQEPLSNGMTTYSNSEYPLPEGTVANYSCNTGYDFTGNHTRTCMKGGWNDSLPFCNASCPRHSLSNGMVNYSTTTDPPPTGTVANYSCNIGYNLNGTETRTCVDTTIGWSSTLPVCNVVECVQPEYPENGTVITPLGIAHVYNEQVRYFCESGHNLNGSATRTCGADGQWSPAVPICQPVNCGTLMNPTNGQVTTTGTTFTNTANYNCDVGYTLNGPSIRRCEVSGVWSQPNQNTTCDNTDSDPPPTDSIPNTVSKNPSTRARDFLTSISILSTTNFLTVPTTIMNPSITDRDFLTTVSILSTTTQDSTPSNTVINPSTTVSSFLTAVSILSTTDFLTQNSILSTTKINPSTTDSNSSTTVSILSTTDFLTQDSILSTTKINPSTTVSNSSTTVSILSTTDFLTQDSTLPTTINPSATVSNFLTTNPAIVSTTDRTLPITVSNFSTSMAPSCHYAVCIMGSVIGALMIIITAMGTALVIVCTSWLQIKRKSPPALEKKLTAVSSPQSEHKPEGEVNLSTTYAGIEQPNVAYSVVLTSAHQGAGRQGDNSSHTLGPVDPGAEYESIELPHVYELVSATRDQ